MPSPRRRPPTCWRDVPDGPTLAAAVHAYTAGWPAAVRMLADALGRAGTDARAAWAARVADEPATASGPADALLDYLAAEVLADTDPDIRPLWSMAVGAPVTASMCRAAGLDATDARLRDLAHVGLLTRDRRGLRRRPDARRAAARRTDPAPPARRRAFADAAARWLRERGRPADALRAVRSLDDPAALADHLAAHGADLLATGEVAAVADAVAGGAGAAAACRARGGRAGRHDPRRLGRRPRPLPARAGRNREPAKPARCRPRSPGGSAWSTTTGATSTRRWPRSNGPTPTIPPTRAPTAPCC